MIAQLKKKGWYATVEAPVFLVNGQRVVDGDTISLSDELFLSQGSYIMYTTDGSYPVSWEENTLGEETPQAILYSKENLAQSLPAGEVTLRAISKNNSNWSATVTRKVFVVDEQANGIARIKNEKITDKNEGIYDLSGRKIDSSLFTLHSSLNKGVYIKNGEKEIR